MYRYTDLAGKKRTIYALTLVELREKEKQIERDLNDGIDTQTGDITLNQLFDLYINSKSDIRESTKCGYKSMWKYTVEPSVIGNMKISQIKPIHITSFYNEHVKRGAAKNTIRAYHSLISPALEMAVNSDLIRKNPAKDGKRALVERKRRLRL